MPEATNWSRGRRPAYRLVPWLLPLVAAVAGLRSIEVPLDATARYVGYFGVCVVLPGVLILRALWRSTGNWAEDIGLGAAVGSACQLVGWGVFTALGWQNWLLAWPLLILAVFAAVPGLRRHWRIADPEPLPLLWHCGLAVAAGVLVVTTIGIMGFHPAPPAGTAYYPDLLYHLSMVNELVRSVPPELPQVAGESLDYHWLPNADMAAAVDITGLSPVMVLYRLWLLPMVVVALLVCATLARTVSKAWWTGLVPAVVLAGPQVTYLVRPGQDLAPPLSFLSPSQTVATVTVTAAAVFLIHLMHRDSNGKGIWVLALSMALTGGGSKPTVLPVLLGAVGLSAVFLLIRDRKLPGRQIAAGALLLVCGVATMLLVAGSTSGSGLQLLAVVKLQAGYRATTGDTTAGGAGGWILPALTSGDGLAVVGVFVVLGTLLVAHLTATAGFSLLVARRTRRDPVGWFLLGALIAGWAGFLLVDHPSASETYFIRTVVPFGAAALGWLLAVFVRGSSRQAMVLTAGAGVVLGTGLGVVAVLARTPPTGGQLERIWAVARPLVALALLAGLLAAGWWLLVRRRTSVRGPGAALAVLTVVLLPTGMALGRSGELLGRAGAFRGVPGGDSVGFRLLVAVGLLAAVLAAAWLLVRRQLPLRRLAAGGVVLTVVLVSTAAALGRHWDLREKAGVFGGAIWQYSADERTAADWLAANSRPDDVVASNTYCRRTRPASRECDARGYLVSGVAGRRTVIEGWAYTQQAMAEQGVDGKKYTLQPSPWPDRVAVTTEGIGAPTTEVMTRLKDQYGVRWIFADPTQGKVSPRLGEFATLRHTSGTVQIYELQP